MTEKQTTELSVRKPEDWLPANWGNGDIFYRRTPAGIIKQVKGKIRLEEKNGQIADLGSSGWSITSEGFKECNKIVGLSTITPKSLTLPDGKAVPNPYPIIDPESGSINKVWVRKVAVGLSPIGNLVITVSTLLYDIKMYAIQDLVKKVKSNKDAGKLCMGATLTDEELKNGIFLPFEGNLGVYARHDNADVIKALDTFIANKLFAERKAQTICERNALRKHPSMPSQKIPAPATGPNGAYFDVVVTGFAHDFTRDDLEEMAERASSEDNVDGAEVVKVDEDATEEDLHAERDPDEDDSFLNND